MPPPDSAVNSRSIQVVWLVAAACIAVVVVLAILATRRLHAPSSASAPVAASSPSSAPALPDFEVKPVSTSEGEAKWYDVPDNSLAQRRAWPGEMTAASDRLPKEAYVRVRRIDGKGDPDKTVVVRITDNGVHNKSTIIDLDRGAAEALGMIKAGQARVRVEVLALKNATTDKPVEKKDATPIAPKASELTDQPTTSEKQEKDAAKAKTGGSVP